MLKYALVGAVGFGLGLFVAKLAYEKKVRDAIGSGLDVAGRKTGVNLRGGFVEQTIDALAGV